LSKNIVLVVIAVDGIEVIVFARDGFVIGVPVRMGIIDGDAIVCGEEGTLSQRFGIRQLGIQPGVLGMIHFILVDQRIPDGKAAAIKLGVGIKIPGRAIVIEILPEIEGDRPARLG
jgi:hypothetical protein